MLADQVEKVSEARDKSDQNVEELKVKLRENIREGMELSNMNLSQQLISGNPKNIFGITQNIIK